MEVVQRSFILSEAEKVWLTSNQHFDHANIIKYCNRPFTSVEEMNAALLNNWNNAVAPSDLVYFLGDFSFGRGSRSVRWWLKRLHGQIVYIKGSHDHGIRTTSTIPNVLRVVLSEIVSVNSLDFLLVHDAHDAVVNGWNGWIIHGHNHDNRPFMDARSMRINVSVEAIDYKPITLAKVYKEVVGL